MPSRRLRRLAVVYAADLRSRGLWRAIVAEFLGCLLLVFFSAAPAVGFEADACTSFSAKVIRAGLVAGIAVTSLIWSLGHVSGGHVNPAVTIAFAVAGKVTIVRALLYAPAQCAGSIVGALTLQLLTPFSLHNATTFGAITFDADVIHPAQAFGFEFVLTFGMMLPVMASTDSQRFDQLGSVPLVIGLQVACCIMAGISFSGAAMNPIRALGPAIVSGRVDQLWVYFTGPISGGAVSSLVYQSLFRGKFMQQPKEQQQQHTKAAGSTSEKESPGEIYSTEF